nr:4697_t:CDS:2 [Entrophospora candida]
MNDKSGKNLSKLKKLKTALNMNEPKLQMEFQYNDERQYTTPRKVVLASDKLSKSASWNENILLNIKRSDADKEANLIIKCWDNRTTGPEGVLMEMKKSIYEMRNYQRTENSRVKICLNEMELTFKIYFIDLCGMSGPLEFKLDQDKHSTKDYWKTSQSEFKWPVSLFLLDKISELTIHCVLSSNQGCPTTKIKIGPSNNKSENRIWENLIKSVGPIPLMERGMDYSNVEFLLTLHTITPISELSSPNLTPAIGKNPDDRFTIASFVYNYRFPNFCSL